MARIKDTIAANAIISRIREMRRAKAIGKVNMNCVVTMTVNGTIKPRKIRRCITPG